MDGVSLRADVTNTSSYWLSLLLSTLLPFEWRNHLSKPWQDVASFPLPFHPFSCPGGILLFQCWLCITWEVSNNVPKPITWRTSTYFLSLDFLLYSQSWTESICCVESWANPKQRSRMQTKMGLILNNLLLLVFQRLPARFSQHHSDHFRCHDIKMK